jgi:hypothetical protein
MREQDIEVLHEPFGEDEVGGDWTRVALERLGYRLESLLALDREFFSDLSPDVLGFSWWESHLSTRLRVLVSDHLVAIVSALPDALIHAWMHLSSWRESRAREDENRSWRLSPRGAYPTPPSSPADLLTVEEQDMHFAGFFRAVGTVLDLCAGLIVGVGALDTNLRRAQWNRTRAMLRQERYSVAAEYVELDALVNDSGPDDWDRWTLDMRNTVVHRPNRLMWSRLSPPWSSSQRSVTWLTAAPNLSEVESMRLHGSPQDALLHEDADQTLAGVLTSVRVSTETLAPRLLRLWRERRENPDLLTQPEGQWETQTPDAPSFRGYARDLRPSEQEIGRMATMNPRWEPRFGAAPVSESQSHRWEE